jgi:hypothetical protein
MHRLNLRRIAFIRKKKYYIVPNNTKNTEKYMVEILGVKYITEKEAAQRYGYSSWWFIKARRQEYGPHYIQIMTFGRILYPLEETDEWFRKRMESKE